jgi:REP element-mobilizing transposase RayT
LELLTGAAEGSDTEVLAYCLMSNHVHLVVVQGQAPLERFTKSLHTGFASRTHRGRRGAKAQGPVYAGRPRTVLAERES